MSSTEQAFYSQVQILIKHNVPKFAARIRSRGGISEKEWDWLQSKNESIEYPQGIVARADEYFLFPKDEETFKKALFTLVKLIAIMSFIPGGIRIFGLHFTCESTDFIGVDCD